MSSVIISSLDLSYRHCGVAKIRYERTENGSQIHLMESGEIPTVPCRSKGIQQVICEVQSIQTWMHSIRDFIQGSDEVIIEMPYGSQSSQAAKMLGICYGMIAVLEVAHECVVPFTYIVPSDLKKWSGKKGNSKTHVYEKVKARFGDLIKTKNDNIIDALGICLMRADQISYEYYLAKKSGDSSPESKPIPRSDRPSGDLFAPF